jgi:ABC-2 type transport system permease protein
MRLRAVVAGVGAVVVRDFRIFTSYRLRFLSEIATAVLSVTLFYFVSRLVTGGAFKSPQEYFAYTIVGLAMLQVLAAAIVALPVSVRQELVAGTFERILVSPLGPVSGVLAMFVFPFFSAAVMALLTIAVGVFVFGMPIRWSTAALALPVALLGSLAFLPFAVLITGAVFVFKQAGAGAGFLVTCVALVAGVFFPVALLPDWIEWTSEVQPLTPALDLLRHLVVGTPIDSVWEPTVRLVAFTAVLLPPSILVLRTCLRHAQRQGTVLEY